MSKKGFDVLARMEWLRGATVRDWLFLARVPGGTHFGVFGDVFWLVDEQRLAFNSSNDRYPTTT